jgi:hypothetical protein
MHKISSENKPFESQFIPPRISILKTVQNYKENHIFLMKDTSSAYWILAGKMSWKTFCCEIRNFIPLTFAHDTYWVRLLSSYHTAVTSRQLLQGYVKTRVTKFIATMMLWIITQLRVCIVHSTSYCIGLNVVSLINCTHRKAMWSSKNECCWFGFTNKSKTTNNSWTIPSINRSAVVPLQMNAITKLSWL